jgi:hypothetical protein
MPLYGTHDGKKVGQGRRYRCKEMEIVRDRLTTGRCNKPRLRDVATMRKKWTIFDQTAGDAGGTKGNILRRREAHAPRCLQQKKEVHDGDEPLGTSRSHV